MGFLAASTEHTNALDAQPIKNRKLETLYAALTAVLDRRRLGPVVRIVADRETALRSPVFRKRLERERGLPLHFVSTRSKSYRSERAIRSIRTWLSKEMERTGTKNWVRALPRVLARHNETKIRGTDFSPSEITRKTFPMFMRQKYNVESMYPLATTHRVDAVDMARPDLVFKFNRDQLVRADRGLVGEVGEKGFDKKSALGYFSRRKFRIHRRVLATSKDLRAVQSKKTVESIKGDANAILLSVYQLRPERTGAPLSGWFYTWELVSADDDDDDDDEEER